MGECARTILIVDDSPEDRELFRRYLLSDQNYAYTILEAGLGQQGLDLWHQHQPVALLLDYHLPDLNGLDFLARLQSLTPQPCLPIVMVTGQGSEAIAVQAIKSGAQEYLVKAHITPVELQRAVQGAIATVQLHTQLQQRDAQLQRSEKRYRMLFESMEDGFCIIELLFDETNTPIDYRFLEVNPAFEQQTGLQQAVGKTARQLLPDLEDHWFEIYGRVALTGEPLHFESGSDVMKRWFDVYAFRIELPQSRKVALLFKNITARKLAEQQLRESEEQLRTGVQVAGIGLARFDYASNLVALSPEAAVLYGFAPEELVVSREQIHATFHPDERAELEEMIVQVLDPQGTGWFAMDHRVLWPNGEVRCLSVRKQVFFDASGAVPRPSYAILAAIDITDRNQTQAELKKRNQELDSFVHIVSHDLKAPLRGISNLSQWIEEDLGELLSADTQQQIALLRSRVHRMEEMINGLLEYARVGRTDDMAERVVVEELLAEVIDSVAPPPTFKITLAPNLPTLYTKRLLLSQVFTNLIGNSIKHHKRPDGSVHVSGQDQGDFYEFVVADDGPGIAPEYHDQIFMIFQAGSPRKSQDSSGIGLSIVKKIVEAEEGSIRLESQLGKGTTFYFHWPK